MIKGGERALPERERPPSYVPQNHGRSDAKLAVGWPNTSEYPAGRPPKKCGEGAADLDYSRNWTRFRSWRSPLMQIDT